MAVFYLKNTSGSKKTVGDLGLVLANGQSTTIDSNNIDGYLSSEMQSAILAGAALGLVLSTTDIGDTSGDLTPANAIKALTITTRYDTDNPHNTTFTQTIALEKDTNVTAAELERLTNDSDVSSGTELHNHDTRYFTKTQLSTSNSGTVGVHWDNITNAPAFGSLSWQAQALVKILGFSSDPSTESWNPVKGDFYINTINGHIYIYDTSWTDYITPVKGNRVVNLTDSHIYQYDTSWTDFSTPEDNWALMVNNDGDGKTAQYIYDTASSKWIKIADVDWGDHNSLGGRTLSGAHPASAITFDNSETKLSAKTVQDALTELSIETSTKIDNIIYVAKNGQDIATYPDSADNLGSITLPYLTIQAAINSIPSSGDKSASSTNRYAIIVAPGDYNENVVLSKPYVYITGLDRTSSRILSSSGSTLTMSSSTENVNGVYDITLESTSTISADCALLLSGNNQEVKDIIVNSPNGAKSIYTTGTYNQRIQHVVIESGEFRIDAGVSYLNTIQSAGSLNVTGGSVRLVDCSFINTSGDAITQSGGTIYYISGKTESGSSNLDINQSAGTIYVGWIDYISSKTLFNGTKNLIFKSKDLIYNNSSSGLTATEVQGAIDELVAQTSAQLTKYIVGKDSFDKFHTIQDAINQAVLDNANPALIYVKPGTYNENIVLHSGIHVSSIDEVNELTKITGSITLTESGTSSIHGISISYDTDTVINVNGSSKLILSNTSISSNSTSVALKIDNTTANIELKDSVITSVGNSILISNGSLKIVDTIISSSVSLENGSMINAESVDFGQPLLFSNSSYGSIKNSTISNNTLDAITYNSSGQLLLIDTIGLGTGSLYSGTTTSNIKVRKVASDIPYDGTISGLSSTNVQSAIDELASEYDVSIHHVIYVAKNGSDSSTTVKLGSFANPYLTVQAAIDSVTDASYLNDYVVFVMPGLYSENLTLKPYVHIISYDKELTRIKTGTGSHVANFANGGRIMIKSVNMGTNQSMDFTHPAGNTTDMTVCFDNCDLGTLTFNMTGGGHNYIQLRNDFYCQGILTVHSAELTAMNGWLASGLLIDDKDGTYLDGNNAASGMTLKDCIGTDLKCSGNVNAEFFNSYSWTTLTSEGSQCLVAFDSQSTPDTPAQLISINGGKFERTDKAFGMGYDNTTSKLVAANVQDAIDELKANITSFKMPKGTLFPSLPEDGDLFYRTDMSLPYQYDASRSKWLTMTKQTLDWGVSSADGRYANIHGSTATQTGYLMPRKGTVISITIKIASGNLNKPLELRRNNATWNSTPSDYTFTPSGGTYSNTILNLDFDVGDYLQTFFPSSGVPARDAVIMIEIAYRE